MTDATSPGTTPSGSEKIPPSFDSLPLSPEVRRAIDAMGYVQPTPVQLAVFEPAVRGKNLVVQARTGTGKTAAFGLPIVDQLVRRSEPRTQALILCPTRELALQVSREVGKLAEQRGVSVIAIYGGAPMGQQIEALAEGAQIVAGTPGRVLDHIRRGTFDTSAVRIFVLDEADEMLSMGFAKELHAIAEALPKDRQGLFFSATIPPDIERLAIKQLKDPEFITLSSDQVGALQIAHFVYIVGPGVDKRREIVRILEVEDPESAVVFCNTRDETERVATALQNAGYDAEWLNGDLEQRERERVMARTREGKLRFLVATDVAARGIDISHLTHVINYDFPEAAESYVHRTGRTGRAGRTGTAISLVASRDVGKLYLLRLTYKLRPIEKQLPSAMELKTRSELDLVQTFVEAFGEREVHPDDRALARRLLTHASGEAVLASLLREHLGARPSAPKDAAEARRAKNPPPVRVEPAPEVPTSNSTAPSGSAVRPPRSESAREHRPSRGGHGDPGSDRGSRDASFRGRSRDSGDRGRSRSRGPDEPTLRAPAPELPGFVEEPFSAVDKAPPPYTGRHRYGKDAGAPVAISDASEGANADFARLFVNVGRRDGARPADLQKLLADQGIEHADTGPINVRDRMSFVSVRRELVDRAIGALAGQIIGGRTVVAEPARERTA